MEEMHLRRKRSPRPLPLPNLSTRRSMTILAPLFSVVGISNGWEFNVIWQASVLINMLAGLRAYIQQMNYLVANDIVEVYHPLMDNEGSYSAQFEHVCTWHFLQRSPAKFPRQFSCENHVRRCLVAEMIIEVISWRHWHSIHCFLCLFWSFSLSHFRTHST